jgi:hypothetical protein
LSIYGKYIKSVSILSHLLRRVQIDLAVVLLGLSVEPSLCASVHISKFTWVMALSDPFFLNISVFSTSFYLPVTQPATLHPAATCLQYGPVSFFSTRLRRSVGRAPPPPAPPIVFPFCLLLRSPIKRVCANKPGGFLRGHTFTRALRLCILVLVHTPVCAFREQFRKKKGERTGWRKRLTAKVHGPTECLVHH